MQSSRSDFESRPLPKSFVLELTRRCNNACEYCYTVWGAPELRYPPVADSTVEEIEQIVARLQDETPVEQIALSGGEPLLRDDLARIVHCIRDRGITPVIITNGTLLAEDRLNDLVGGTAFEVTLLSHRRDVHDRLVRRSGAWDAVVHGFANLWQRKASVTAAFIATKLNYADVAETAELAIALGAQALMFNRMNLGAFNRRHAGELLPDAAMIRTSLDLLDGVAAKWGLPVSVSVVIEPCVVDVAKYEHLRFGWCPLAGENSYFTIDPAGNVRICNHSPAILGNLKRERFTEIYRRHPYVRTFAETLPDECAGCRPEWLSVCRGGCRAAAEQVWGSLQRVDPFVTMAGNA